ncbi:MAG: hypothetical protein KBT34_04935 [Prevotella sp.]|nr:hypothetical protein [Candidatus Prevotella equi]
MDLEFNKKVMAWLDTPANERDYAQGALFLLQLSNNQVMYRNMMANPKKRADFIVHQIRKYMDFRLQRLTHEEVEQMQLEVNKIVTEHALDKGATETSSSESASVTPSPEQFRKGMRSDHEALPPEVQALYVENADIMHKMRDLHAKLRVMNTENATCPDSERYPFLKELIRLDKAYHKNWQLYDSYNVTAAAEGAEQVLIEDERQHEKSVYRQINLAKGRYKKSPTDKLKEQIYDLYQQLSSPVESLTKELMELGIIAAKEEDSTEVAGDEMPTSDESNDNDGAEDEGTAE